MQTRSKQYLVAAAVVVVTASILSACSGPAPTQNELDFTSLEDGATDQQTIPAEMTQPTSTTPTDTSTVLGKNTMKQLSDFAPIEGSTVTMKTSKGDVVVELFRDKAPLTTLNFLTLAKEGFYDGIVFHRVIPDFMAQVGDPLTRDPSKQNMWGTGGAGYTIADEFSPDLKHDSEGILSMANSGPNSGSSQIFITYAATPWLDGKHAVFGKVTSGMEVLRQLENGDGLISVTFE